MPSRLALLLLLVLLSVAEAAAQYQCPDTCTLPACHCAAATPPGGLAVEDTPQFILLTLDDAVHAYSEQLVATFAAGLVNPDGRPARRTYFVNVTNTEPDRLRALYDAGHEVANHTATHDTGTATSRDAWRAEITQLDQFLAGLGIPASDVVGFRAPYLATNEALWQALQERAFLYDTTIPEQPTTPPLVSTGVDGYVWPHTLDHGAALSCYANHCPAAPVPGLWTIPLWAWIGQDGVNYGSMDPAAGRTDVFGPLLNYTFDSRYAGNRAPLGLFLHAGQMWQPERQQALRAFLEDRLSRPDVWMVTARGLVEWMRAPVPNDQMAAWFARGCDRGACRASGVATEAHTEAFGAEATVYPYPTDGPATLAFTGVPAGPGVLEVLDVLGRVVQRRTLHLAAGRTEVALDLSALAPGLYLYRVHANGAASAQGFLMRR